MKTLEYRDTLVSCYAMYLCKELAKAEIQERAVLIARLDDILKWDGTFKDSLQLPYSPSAVQPLDDKPSPEVEHSVLLTNRN